MIDSNKLAEKREVKEDESPVKPSPAKEPKENTLEEKEKDSAEDAEDTAKRGKEMVPSTPEPKPLHKTYSLFMRNIPPCISKADIGVVSWYCRSYQRYAGSSMSCTVSYMLAHSILRLWVCSFLCEFVCLWVCSFVCGFVCLWVCGFVCSFVRLCVSFFLSFFPFSYFIFSSFTVEIRRFNTIAQSAQVLVIQYR